MEGLEMTRTTQAAVEEFMTMIGTATQEPDERTAALRVGLVLEEWHETDAAMRAGDAVEAADGLADMLYVVAGAAVAYGLRLPDVFPDTAGLTPRTPGAGDALYLARFVSGPLAEMAEALTTIHLQVGTATARTRDALELAVGGLALATGAAANRLGWPLRELFAEVHRSNMTKGAGAAPGSGDASKRGSKGPGYTPPDIEGVLRAAGWAGAPVCPALKPSTAAPTRPVRSS